MIKSVFSAHLNEQDKNDLTLLFDDKSIGLLSKEDKTNFVLSSNRDVHMICGFSNRSIYYDPRFNKDRIRLWNHSFREMQSHGIKSFPHFVRDHHIFAENLYIFSADIFIGWQDRKNGLYLLRNGNIYRLQPTVLPANVFDEGWMEHTDFYAFNLKANDCVFSISERAFARVDAAKIEGFAQSKMKLSTIMDELMNQLRVYNSELDLSWFGFEIERLDKNVFSDDQTRLRNRNDFTRLINSSRVSRVKDGQKLIPVAKSEQIKTSTLDAGKVKIFDQYNLQKKSEESKRKRFNNEAYSSDTGKEVRKNNIHQLEQRRKNSDILLDDLQSYSFEPIFENLKATLSNLFNLIPDKPLLSKLLSTAIILVLVLFIFLFGRTIGSRTKTVEVDPTEPVFETRKMEVDDEVIPPDSYTLEIDVTVKANNLQIRQEPNSNAAIVATVQRGAKVTQLSEIENNWVYVRLEDEKTVGYAYADSLFPKD